MTPMHKLALLIILIINVFVTKHLAAQSALNIDAGEVFSTFKYSDSNGSEKNFTSNITSCFSLGYQYTANSGLFIKANVGLRKAGASFVYNKTNIDWNLQYTTVDLGVGYILNKWRLKPYISASPYFAYMLKGEETLGQYSYDIKQNKSMSGTDFGVYISPGVKIALSNFVSFYAEYKQILGLQNLETTTGQASYNRGFSVNLGIAITFLKYNYVTFP
jgi:hypothetical protein